MYNKYLCGSSSFNRFSVAMVTCSRLTERDERNTHFLGDQWRHAETPLGLYVCVCESVCVIEYKKVNEQMCCVCVKTCV